MTATARRLTRLEILVNIRFPGDRANGIQVAAMAEALAAAGLNVDLVVPRRFPHREVDPFEHYGVRRIFTVHRLVTLDAIDLLPTRWQRLPFLVQSASFGYRALARVATDREAGLFVRDLYTLEILGRGLRARDRGRLAAEVHTLPEDPGRRARALRTLASLPAVVAISSGVRDDLLAGGVEPGNVLVAHDGVHLSRFAHMPDAPTARRHLNLDERPTLVYAGQFFPWKGVDTLVEAMAHLPEAQLLLIGGDKANLPRIVGLADRVAPGRIHLTGQVPHAAVPFHLSAGDVVVLPNSGRQEISARHTSPLKLFEAMAVRRPIVASDLPSLREILTDGSAAVMVPPDDPAALAEAARALLDDPGRGERLARRAGEEVGRYDWSARGRDVARFLRDRLVFEGGP